MATIAENIQTLRSIKSDIKNAIIQKGGSVTDAFGTYAQAITNLPSGGGGGTEIEDALVTRTLSGTYYNDRVSVVGDYAFYSCSNLISVSFPNCTSVGKSTFAYCSTLQSISLPNCLYLDSHALSACSALTNVSLPLCISINTEAMFRCDALTSVDLPKCEYLNTQVFGFCSSLTNVNLQDCISIGDYTFRYCSALPYIDLPNCTSIGNYAFENCGVLSVIKIPKVLSLSRYVFSNCSSLRQLYINGGSQIVNLNAYASYIFSGLSLAVIYVPSSLYSSYVYSTYSYWGRMSSFFAAYTSSIQSIYLSLQNGTSSVIELNTTFMPQISWFMENYSTNPITMIDAPNCESIMKNGVRLLSYVTSVSLPNCRYIDDFGMKSMTNLTEINLPNLEYTNNSPFAYCSSVSIIKIPICKSLGTNAFSFCYDLKEVYLNSVTSVTSINTYTFSNCPNLTSVYVPASLVDAFKTAQYWSSISNKIVAYTGA